MILFPNAKINLGLRIVGKRVDGYHLLETCFLSITMEDVLEITLNKGSEDRYIFGGITLEGALETHTVYRTIALLRKRGFSIPPLQISLIKAIPAGAGLGGGSSDAAFTLKGIVDLCNLSITTQEQEDLIALIGADCPFFITNEPVLAYGIGNILQPTDIPDDLRHSHLTLVTPPFGISTKEAYQQIKLHTEEKGLLKEKLSLPIEQWSKEIINDFEEALFPLYPQLATIKNELYNAGALYASMSGSGSTLYAFSKEPLRIPRKMTIFDDCLIWQGSIKI